MRLGFCLCLGLFPVFSPSIITAAITHYSLKYPSLTAISVPLTMSLTMCCFACSFGSNYGSHL